MKKQITLPMVKAIDQDLNITFSLNPECQYRWYQIGIGLNYRPALKKAQKFVSEQGRLKYIVPIYQALLDNGQRNIAINWYEKNLKFYHPIASNKIKSMLKLKDWEIKKDMFFYYRAMYHDMKELLKLLKKSFYMWAEKKGFSFSGSKDKAQKIEQTSNDTNKDNE